jgi:hypothetical protein
MSDSAYMTNFAGNDNCLEERTSTRIRRFLAVTKPIDPAAEDIDTFQTGKALIEDLAEKCRLERTARWDAADCASVLCFIHLIQPMDGECFCNDASRVNATCGYHAVLEFMEQQMWRMAETKPRHKRSNANPARKAHPEAAHV